MAVTRAPPKRLTTPQHLAAHDARLDMLAAAKRVLDAAQQWAAAEPGDEAAQARLRRHRDAGAALKIGDDWPRHIAGGVLSNQRPADAQPNLPSVPPPDLWPPPGAGR